MIIAFKRERSVSFYCERIENLQLAVENGRCETRSRLRGPSGAPALCSRTGGWWTSCNSATEDAQVAEEMRYLDKMEISIRHAFARKVFALLAVQIVTLMAVICIFMYVPPIRDYCQTTSSTWLTVVSGFLFLFVLIAISCIPDINKKYPRNVIGLFIMSSLAGVFVGTFAADINSVYVWVAFASTLGLMLILGLFASQTRYDFTGIGPYLSVGVLMLFVFGLFGGFAPAFRDEWSNGARGILWTAIAVFLFSMYIVYDMQLVLGGKHKRGLRFGVDDYVIATISLFTDFLIVFTLIMGASQN